MVNEAETVPMHGGPVAITGPPPDWPHTTQFNKTFNNEPKTFSGFGLKMLKCT